ncbi:MAG: hypothetical protein ABFC28_01535 [Rikenellaceae bacterium]
MELVFEHSQTVGTGNWADLIHLWDNEANLLYIKDGRMRSTYTITDNGEWDDRKFINDVDISQDDNISYFRIDNMGGFGAVGSYLTGSTHKLVIYEYQFDLSEYLNSGSIKHSVDNPISSFSLILENPKSPNPDYEGNVAIDEEQSLISPGAKVIFTFGAGQEVEEYEMGTFYVDRGNFTLLSETASVDGRNSIGKVLKDQTIDENNEFWYGLVSDHLKALLEQSGLNRNQYTVENAAVEGWFNFSPNTTPFKAAETMLEVLPQWKIRELVDGTIVIGSSDYAGFDASGVYTFYRVKDIFSRQKTMDDAEAYNRVCVHTENYGKAVFRDVASFQSWNLQAKKTLYVQVSEGLKQSDLEAYANELALRLEGVGKLESFTGPFRPYLQCGDEAVIVSEKGNNSLGLITEITHNFGKGGFYTDFAVDSGGTVGKGRLSDYIAKIATGSMGQKSNVGWNDIDTEEYVNLAPIAQLITSSTRKAWLPPKVMVDGRKYNTEDDTSGGDAWQHAISDESPYIEFRFGQSCLIDKINMWVGADDPEAVLFIPEYYRIEYWNGAFWVEIVEVDSNADLEITHEFEVVETSRIRFVLEVRSIRRYREIEIWGNM